MGKVVTIIGNQQPRHNLIKVAKEDLVDIDLIDHQIYNNLPLNLYEDDAKEQKRIIKKLLFEGEKYKIIEDLANYNYFITDLGRVFNIKRCKPMTIVNFKNKYLTFTCEKKRWKLCELMEKAGFEYNKNKLIEYYRTIDYPYRNEKR